jgi:N6-adenosine-specific RNA methylase IME4
MRQREAPKKKGQLMTSEAAYLEMSAHETRPGWTAWGNEVTKFDLLQRAA